VSSAIFLCFAHVSRESLEPRNIAGYGHTRSVRRLVALIDGMTVDRSSPNNSMFYSWRALTNLVVLIMSPYSCLLFQMCRSYADLGLLVFICLKLSL
jgi:hypothetical protein